MSNLLINEPPLQVLPTLAVEIGLNEAIVLQQIHYWLSNKKVGKWHEGQKWVRNTIQQWQQDNFPFWSEDTVRRILTKLEAKGYASSANLNQSAYDRTLWYTINYEALPNHEMYSLPLPQNAEMDSSRMPTPIPETTTETTDDNHMEPIEELVNYFLVLSYCRRPSNGEYRTKWLEPLVAIYKAANNDFENTKLRIKEAVGALRAGNYTIANPGSIQNTAVSLQVVIPKTKEDLPQFDPKEVNGEIVMVRRI